MLAKSLKRMVALHDQTAVVLPGCRQRANRLFGPRSEARSLHNAFGYGLGVPQWRATLVMGRKRLLTKFMLECSLS